MFQFVQLNAILNENIVSKSAANVIYFMTRKTYLIFF